MTLLHLPRATESFFLGFRFCPIVSCTPSLPPSFPLPRSIPRAMLSRRHMAWHVPRRSFCVTFLLIWGSDVFPSSRVICLTGRPCWQNYFGGEPLSKCQEVCGSVVGSKLVFGIFSLREAKSKLIGFFLSSFSVQ